MEVWDGCGGMNMTFVFAKLGRRCQSSIHLRIVEMPDDKMVFNSEVLEAAETRAVSSAKRDTPGETNARSLTYTRNRRGPRMDPWGTPEMTGKGGDEHWSTTTDCVRPVK